VQKFPRQISLDELRQTKSLEGLALLQKGSRLSVIPVSEKHFDILVKMASKKAPA
jgi:predicted RNA-binding protein with PUA-like domain